jgi:2-keto-4-pentenoate hydratase/2-oxohepta-3-ene-1,7-dioic acid hydratase in catechol pathway
MRIATIEIDGTAVWGRVTEEGDALIPAVDLAPSLRLFLDGGGTEEELRELTGGGLHLDAARFLPPVPDPPELWCVGLNFDDYRRMLGLDFLRAPNIFLKAPSALTGHGSEVGVPAGYGTVFHEWELTALVGRELRDASPSEAAEAIFGYTILHDLTFHEIELVNRDHQQWAKNVDGFAPCGPWIVTPDELDLDAGLRMRRWRNGELEAESSSDEMRHQHPELLSFISTFSTLHPGDLVTGGTPPAGPCGAGDEISGAIEGIGTLTVRLVEREVDPQWQVVLEDVDDGPQPEEGEA